MIITGSLDMPSDVFGLSIFSNFSTLNTYDAYSFNSIFCHTSQK